MFSSDDYRRGRSVVCALHAHLVFVTKYRRGVLTDELPIRCQQVMRQVCTDSNTTLVEFNGEHDHLHLLIEYPPTVQLSKLVNSLTGLSARRQRYDFTYRVNQHSTNGHLWSPSTSPHPAAAHLCRSSPNTSTNSADRPVVPAGRN
jgi:putative transposase